MTGVMVQVRGASGSGKSTLVRRWVEDHGPPLKYMMKSAAAMGLGHVDVAAARPYALMVPVEGGRVVVPGHYEAAGGGADMVKSKAHIYDIADKALSLGHSVLIESLFISKDVTLTLERYGTAPIILHLDLPEYDCLQSVHNRRAALGKPHREMRAHHADFQGVTTAIRKLREAGVTVESHTRESCASRVRELLG